MFILHCLMRKQKCEHCEHEWVQRIDFPYQCPKCRKVLRPHYDVKLEQCPHCLHKWTARSFKPKICPKCGRRYYGREEVSSTEGVVIKGNKIMEK